MPAYTSGDWKVKSGKEQEFISAWKDIATWATDDYDPDGWGKLLRDKEDPSHFVSVGEWRDERTIEQWRASEGFKQRVDALKRLVEDVRLHAYELTVEVGRVPLHR